MSVSDEKMELQSKEFDAMDKLAKEWKRLQMTPVVDDDYGMVRHDYEGALRHFIEALGANNRLPQLETKAEIQEQTLNAFKEELLKSLSVLFRPHVEGVCAVVSGKLAAGVKDGGK